jgi:hypothetical protein
MQVDDFVLKARVCAIISHPSLAKLELARSPTAALRARSGTTDLSCIEDCGTMPAHRSAATDTRDRRKS